MMNLKNYKTNQQLFEFLGAVVTGLALGYLSTKGEVRRGEYLLVVWKVSLSVGGYLCALYFVNRQFRFANWSYRPHWILTCGIGTTLVYSALEAADFFNTYGPVYGMGKDLVAALAQEVTMFCLMTLPFAGGVWFVGFVFRQVMARFGEDDGESHNGV